MYSNFSGTEYRQDNTTAVNIETRVFYHIFLGIRLPAPESLNRKTLGIEKKLSKKNK